MYFNYLSHIYQKYIYQKLSGYLSENVLYVMIYRCDSFEFKLYGL